MDAAPRLSVGSRQAGGVLRGLARRSSKDSRSADTQRRADPTCRCRRWCPGQVESSRRAPARQCGKGGVCGIRAQAGSPRSRIVRPSNIALDPGPRIRQRGFRATACCPAGRGSPRALDGMIEAATRSCGRGPKTPEGQRSWWERRKLYRGGPDRRSPIRLRGSRLRRPRPTGHRGRVLEPRLASRI